MDTSNGKTSIVELLTNRASFLVECLNLPEAAECPDAKWEKFQIAHLNDNSTFRIEDKSRQIAWSFTVAAEAVANAILYGKGTVLVSINLVEAVEKIRYARRVYRNLDVSGLPMIIKDNELGLEFSNGARIISHPSRPTRGMANMHVILDEFAHVMHARAIYRAAVPVLSRGGHSRLRIGSSPKGATGVFWEISRQALKVYPGYTRVQTPWWKVKAFCKDGVLPIDAESLLTEERVRRYGDKRIQMWFDNMVLDDFQQEYECIFVDESTSYFPWDLITRNQDETLQHWHIKHASDADSVVIEIKAAIAAGLIDSVLVGGVDIGRKKHLTEIILVGIDFRMPVRVMVSLDRVKFDEQEQCLRRLIDVLPIAGLLIDENGIGMQLAENLSSNTMAEGVTFTNASKALWAAELKIQLERGNVPLPVDNDLAYQIHSVKKKVTAAKNSVFDTDANEQHHADKMWALALAVWAAREYADRPTGKSRIYWERR